MKLYLATITEVLSLSLFMSFKIFNFGQIKIICCGYITFKYLLFRNESVYKYKFLIRNDNYFRTILSYIQLLNKQF